MKNKKPVIRKIAWRWVVACLLLTALLGIGWEEWLQNSSMPTRAGKRRPEKVLNDFSQLKGRILFQSDRDGNDEIYAMTPAGTEMTRLTHNKAYDGYPVWSFDGDKIVFESNREGRFQIYVMRANGRDPVRITADNYDNRYPCWAPNGKRIAYQSQRKDGLQIYVVDIATGQEQQLTHHWYRSGLPNWSPNGDKIAFTVNKLMGWGVYVMNADGSRVQALETEGGACRPHWSKNGDLIAYVSQKSDGKGDIWIMQPDGSGKRRLTTDSANYDYYPAWSGDGNWIVYAHTGDKKKGNWEIRVISVQTGKSTQITTHSAQDRFPNWNWHG